MEKQPSPGGEILLYENGGEKEFVSVVFQDETFWLYPEQVWRSCLTAPQTTSPCT